MPNKMTKRLAVYLPDGIYEFLEQWADEERRSISNLAAVLLELMARDREGWLVSQSERIEIKNLTTAVTTAKSKRNQGKEQNQP